jgi:hypothetical protein
MLALTVCDFKNTAKLTPSDLPGIKPRLLSSFRKRICYLLDVNAALCDYYT